MLTLLESAWFALNLENQRRHPVHRGWMTVFEHWIGAQHVYVYWDGNGKPWTGLRDEFSPVFQRFVESVRADVETKRANQGH